MPVINYGSIKINVDDEGFLVNSNEWNETVACALAENAGVEELTKERIEILKFIHEYYKQFNYFPILNAVCKNVRQPKNCVNEQFFAPLTAWKLAGLPKPDETLINIIEYGQTPT